MKKIIVYKSSTGFTQRYSEWMAEELGCETISLKMASPELLAGYDLVIFGGGFMGGMVSGFDKIKKMYQGNMILFGTGATPAEATEMIDKAKEQNLSEEEAKIIPFFYMQSGLCYERMNFMSKMMMKMLTGMLKKKKEPTLEDKMMLEHISKSFDVCDKSKIAPLVECVRAME